MSKITFIAPKPPKGKTSYPAWIFDNSPIADPLGYGERAVNFLKALKHPKNPMPGKASADRLEQSFAGASKGVNLALSAMKGGIAGLVAGFSVAAIGGIVSRVGEIAKGVASIADEARRAGLSVKAFQELKFVAEQNRIGVDSLTDGFKELSLRADEFIITGQGSAADAFKRLGFTAVDLKRKLQDPSALFSEIIGKLGQLNKAAQIRIADEVFGGTGGEKFVQLIGQGEDGIRRTVQQAHDLGLVLNEDVIARADEIDRKFNAISGTVGSALKKAVVDVVGAMDDFLDRFNKLDEQTDRNIQSQLVGTYDKLRDAKKQLEDLQGDKAAFPKDAAVDLNIDKQKALIEELTDQALKLRDILDRRNGYSEGFIYKTGEDAKTAKPPVDTLNTTLSATGTSAANGATGINSYAEAIRALKNEVPELAKSLADLDAQTKINGAYRAALGKATSVQEVLEANALRDQAQKTIRGRGAAEAGSKGFLDLIGYAEGTDKGRGYNETLARGAFTGGDRNLVTMTLDEIDAMQTAMLKHPGNKFNSSAVGRYQIVQKTMRGLREKMGLSGSDYFDKGVQDRMAEQLMRGRGNDPAGLRNEWEGLRNVDDATIRSSFDGSTVNMPSIDPGIAQKNEALKDQAKTYQDIITQSRAFVTEQTQEQAALGMSAIAASKMRYEQQMLNEAQRAGIAVTPQQRSEISALAQGMAEAEQATQRFAMTQEQAGQVSDFFASQSADALTGLIMGTTSAEDALKGLITSLAKAALQAALLGEGPLAGLLGGGTGGKGGAGGGILGSLFGAIFGAKDGGQIQAFAGGGRVRGPGGPRSDSVPAWLSDGEHVVNAKAAGKNRKLLESINAGRTPALPSVAIGGGSAAARSVNNITNTFAPTIPITVQASGNKDTDGALADRLSKEIDTLLDQKMKDFTMDQQRPGNMMAKNRFV